MSDDPEPIQDLRRVTAELRTRHEDGLADTVEQATSEIVAENQRQTERIAQLRAELEQK